MINQQRIKVEPIQHQQKQTIQIADYKLVFCDDEVFRTWRCFYGRSLLGLLFEHPTHWSNGVDRIRYAFPLDAAVGLDDFMKVARLFK